MADLSTPLLDMVNTKLAETGTDCSDPRGPKQASLTLPQSDAESEFLFCFCKKPCNVCANGA